MAGSALIREQVNKLKQELILDKAIDLFYEHGYHGTSMGQIAAGLGVTKPFLYYRYESKADILDEVFSRAEALVLEATLSDLASKEPPESRLRSIIRRVVESAIDNQRLLAVFYNEERNLPAKKITRSRKLRAEWQVSVAKLLEEGKRDKVFHFGDAGITVNAMLGAVLWSYHWSPSYGRESRDRLIFELTEAAMAIAKGSAAA